MVNHRHVCCQQIPIVLGNAQIAQRTIARYYMTLVGDRFQATRLFQSIEKLLLTKQIKNKSVMTDEAIQFTMWFRFFISNIVQWLNHFANLLLCRVSMDMEIIVRKVAISRKISRSSSFLCNLSNGLKWNMSFVRAAIIFVSVRIDSIWLFSNSVLNYFFKCECTMPVDVNILQWNSCWPNCSRLFFSDQLTYAIWCAEATNATFDVARHRDRVRFQSQYINRNI